MRSWLTCIEFFFFNLIDFVLSPIIVVGSIIIIISSSILLFKYAFHVKYSYHFDFYSCLREQYFHGCWHNHLTSGLLTWGKLLAMFISNQSQFVFLRSTLKTLYLYSSVCMSLQHWYHLLRKPMKFFVVLKLLTYILLLLRLVTANIQSSVPALRNNNACDRLELLV